MGAIFSFFLGLSGPGLNDVDNDDEDDFFAVGREPAQLLFKGSVVDVGVFSGVTSKEPSVFSSSSESMKSLPAEATTS